MSTDMYATANDLRQRADAIQTELHAMGRDLAATRDGGVGPRVNFYTHHVDSALGECLATISNLQSKAAELVSEAAAAEQPPRKVEGK